VNELGQAEPAFEMDTMWCNKDERKRKEMPKKELKAEVFT
jgi:hypothetical protein